MPALLPPAVDPSQTPAAGDVESPWDRTPTDPAPRVLWTKGDECRTLAEVLAGKGARRAEADLVESCIKAGAVLLSSRRLTTFDLCSLAVPHGFSPSATQSVVAAVGSGPHSPFAAAIAQRLAHRLGVPARAISGYQRSNEQHQALNVLESITTAVPGLDAQPMQTPNPATMIEALPAGTLLVVGASGGSWFERQFFGHGARIQAKAPSGTIVVKHAPTRIYQVMHPTTAFGPHMRVADAHQLRSEPHLVVAQDGQLLGLISAEALQQARPDLELREIMDDPVFVSPDEDLDHAAALIEQHTGMAIPVVDTRNRIIGSVTAGDLQPRPLI